MKLIFLLCLVMIIVSPVCAFESIRQGGNVYLNETIDISGMLGWGSSLAYYGNAGASTPTYIINVSKEYAFFINPTIFKQRPGEWYQWEGSVSSSHGNDLVFVVIPRERNNVDINNISVAIENISTVDATTPVPVKHVADYLVARGDKLEVKTLQTANVWIFGTEDGLYNKRTTGGYARFSVAEIDTLIPDTYTMLVQYTGVNGEFNVAYDSKNYTINTLTTYLDGWNIYKENVKGLSPNKVLDELMVAINKTDDKYEVFSLVVKHPYISITSRDNVDTAGDLGKIVVTGYTNVAEGTILNFSIDDVKFKDMRVKPFTSIPARATNNPGDMRYFVAYIPFYYSDLKVGAHTITATSAIGGSTTVEFHVYSLPEGSQRPSTSTKYINGSEYLPQPTPEIIKVIETQIIEKEVVRTVTVVQTITPNLQEIYYNQKKANDDTILRTIGLVVGILVTLYVASIVLRGMYGGR